MPLATYRNGSVSSNVERQLSSKLNGGIGSGLACQFKPVGLAQRNPTFPKHYRRTIVPGGTFFFTLVTDRSQPVLASDEAVDVLRNAFRAVRQSRPFGSRFGRFVKADVHASDWGRRFNVL